MDKGLDEAGIRLLFAKNLKHLREISGVSQLNLSTLTGLTHNFINDIENCNRWVSAETIAKIAKALDVEPFRLFLPESRWNEPEITIYLEDVAASVKTSVNEALKKHPPGK
jgi:transcriptional regulator with XRE-family HTH domain